MKKFMKTAVACSLMLTLAACGVGPDKKVAVLTADEIKSLTSEIDNKVKASRAQMKAINENIKFGANWNTVISAEIDLLRSVQGFSDLSLTERAGLPRIALQNLLRGYNERNRTAKERLAKDIADAEKAASATFTKVVFARISWDKAYAETMKGARERSSRERFQLMVDTAQDAWKKAQEDAKATADQGASEALK